MFGVQTFFISKSFGYLIRITNSFDQSFLDKEIFLIFFFAMNIIDWIAFFLALIYNLRGHNFNKSFINFSALFVYFGLIIFLIMVISEYHLSINKKFQDMLVLKDFFKSKYYPNNNYCWNYIRILFSYNC